MFKNNCTVLRNVCARYGVEIAGVTKATGGNPNIAEAMLDAGIPALADSRLTNIRRLRDAGITAPIMLVRAPTFAEIPDAAQLADVFLLSDINTIRTFPIACKAIGKAAKIIVMVDMGDLREGIPPANLPNLLDQIEATENASIIGIGTNLACNIGILPDEENMQHLAQLSRETEAKIGRRLRYVSAGNSSAIALLVEGKMPSEINHLRLGESLFLGRETAFGQRIEGTSTERFTIHAQVLEIWQRRIQDTGQRGLNALGHKTSLVQTGLRKLAVLNLGAVDVEIGGLTPLASGVEVMGFSSDHIIADITEAVDLIVGSDIGFGPNYHALTTAMTSPYLLQCKDAVATLNSKIMGAQHAWNDN